ncbi:MAG: sugar-binding transcriptional regulator [Pelolinea sp.]|nr:sugar-binding transcriptional regulator [Pelolinea sp.]
MPRNKTIDYRLLLKVSKLYYEKALTQNEISKRLILSRPKVSRLLKQAEEAGVVKINIIPQPGVHTDLEDALESKFGLKEAIVVEVSEPSSQIAVSREVGVAAADYFSRAVSDPCVIGISWGTTLRAMVDALHAMDCQNSQVVQLIGGLGMPESEAHATYILRRLVTQIGSKLSILNVPGIVDNTAVKKAVLSDSHVREIFDMFAKIDIAFVGIGVPTPDSVVMRDGTILTKEEMKMLLKKGAIGDICLRYFDEKGNAIQSEVDDRVIGITLDELKKIDRVVGVTGGPHKDKVIRAALVGKLVNVLITDQQSAKKLLED